MNRLRRKIWEKVIEKYCGQVYPLRYVLLRFILFPLDSFYHFSTEFQYYNMNNDTYTIEGVKFAGTFFRTLGSYGIKRDCYFKIIERLNGDITIREYGRHNKNELIEELLSNRQQQLREMTARSQSIDRDRLINSIALLEDVKKICRFIEIKNKKRNVQ